MRYIHLHSWYLGRYLNPGPPEHEGVVDCLDYLCISFKYSGMNGMNCTES
jgi:hypothetical protein